MLGGRHFCLLFGGSGRGGGELSLLLGPAGTGARPGEIQAFPALRFPAPVPQASSAADPHLLLAPVPLRLKIAALDPMSFSLVPGGGSLPHRCNPTLSTTLCRVQSY